MLRVFIATLLVMGTLSCRQQQPVISLAGTWQLSLENGSEGPALSPEDRDYSMSLYLPGTLDSAGIGEPVLSPEGLNREVMLHLQRKVSYIGKAWYRREVSIPQNWEGKHIRLTLGRVLWESQVWVDGIQAGKCLSLSTAHRYDLSGLLTPGRHELIICVDNSRKLALSRNDMAHAYTEETQIKWNGILGEISLEAWHPVNIQRLDVFADFKNHSVSGRFELMSDGQAPLRYESVVTDPAGKILATAHGAVVGMQGDFSLTIDQALSGWGEFTPELYRLSLSLLDEEGNEISRMTKKFGFRDLSTENGQLYLNGARIFLRGTLECCIFPLTGHPPMDYKGWEKVFLAARDYGLNHLRFHSWCPPQVAFEAADSLGFYLQVELPNWSLDFGSDPSVVAFIQAEADAIIRDYGHHPSFCMLALGNELEGDYELLTGMLTDLRSRDPRHLYTTTSYTFQQGHGLVPEPVDDFFITQRTDRGWIRGQGIFDQYPPDFKTDYTSSVEHIGVPVISHEIGQYSVFPDMNEIGSYTGVLVPANFKAVQADLQVKGISHERAEAYTRATGRFATLLYKEEIERAMKTPGLSGFQLLDLHDFPGQGTALVGVLNAFWESKGFTDGNEWRMFCNQVVPLLWFDKAVYTSSEVFEAELGVSNFSQELENNWIEWRINDQDAKVVARDSVFCPKIVTGGATKYGSIRVDLSTLQAPAHYEVELTIGETGYQNRWSIWVYPEDLAMPDSEVVFTTSFDEALKALQQGAKVLLSPETNDIEGVSGKFVPVFWSPVHFPDQPGTMGLLVDTLHPGLREFPTAFQSDWQWWDVCKRSKAVSYEGFGVEPLVVVIDNFFKNRRLCNTFEARVGDGKLMFCSADLHSELEQRPVARQLRYSLTEYMAGEDFHPDKEITIDQLMSLRSGTR